MKAIVLAIFLLSFVTTSNANQLYGDDEMKGCIRNMIDSVGAVNADNVNIVKTCLCLQSEINTTATTLDMQNALAGNDAVWKRKEAAATKKCAVFKITNAPTSRNNSDIPDTSRKGVFFTQRGGKQEFLNMCVSGMKEGKGNYRLEEMQQICNCAGDELDRTVTELDLTRTNQGDNSGLNNKVKAAQFRCADQIRKRSDGTTNPTTSAQTMFGGNYKGIPTKASAKPIIAYEYDSHAKRVGMRGLLRIEDTEMDCENRIGDVIVDEVSFIRGSKKISGFNTTKSSSIGYINIDLDAFYRFASDSEQAEISKLIEKGSRLIVIYQACGASGGFRSVLDLFKQSSLNNP